MACILSIETSTNVCSTALHHQGNLLASNSFHLAQSHSSLLPGIVKDLLNNCDIKINDLEAIAVSGGPGSYTGLRIGVSTAKGIAYANNIPLIALNSLEIMCELPLKMVKSDALLCPMIDARRMEVYGLLQSTGGKILWETRPIIVEADSFEEFDDHPIYFFGNGSGKCKELLNKDNHIFIEDMIPEAQYMGRSAYSRFQSGNFEDIAYYEPNYLKAYRTNKPAVKF